MEIVYAEEVKHFSMKKINAFYGDVLDLNYLGIEVNGIVYDDEWTVKRFLNGLYLGFNKRINNVFKYLDIDSEILNIKLKDLAKVKFKYILLAYLLIKNKDIIIFDHFDIGLSNKEQKKLIKIIRTLKNDGKTIIVISKDLVFLSQLCNDIMVMRDGEVLYNGDILELITSDKKIVNEPKIIEFIKLANKKGANLAYTYDSKELLKDIYRSVN